MARGRHLELRAGKATVSSLLEAVSSEELCLPGAA